MSNDNSDDDANAQAVMPGRSPDRDQMAADYLPDSDDWLAKTVLDLNDPHAVSALGQFYRMFPEVDDLQPIIDEFAVEFMKGRTSVKGKSREDYKEIIQAQYGQGGENDAASNLGKLLADTVDED